MSEEVKVTWVQREGEMVEEHVHRCKECPHIQEKHNTWVCGRVSHLAPERRVHVGLVCGQFPEFCPLPGLAHAVDLVKAAEESWTEFARRDVYLHGRRRRVEIQYKREVFRVNLDRHTVYLGDDAEYATQIYNTAATWIRVCQNCGVPTRGLSGYCVPCETKKVTQAGVLWLLSETEKQLYFGNITTQETGMENSREWYDRLPGFFDTRKLNKLEMERHIRIVEINIPYGVGPLFPTLEQVLAHPKMEGVEAEPVYRGVVSTPAAPVVMGSEAWEPFPEGSEIPSISLTWETDGDLNLVPSDK